MKFSMIAIVAAAMSAGVHGFAGTPLKTNFAVRQVRRWVRRFSRNITVRSQDRLPLMELLFIDH